MAVFSLEDLEGSVEVVVFPELFKSCQGRLGDDRVVLVKGKAELEDGRWRLIAEEVSPLAGAAERRASRVVLDVNTSGLRVEGVSRLRDLLRDHPGECPLEIRLTQPGGFRLTLRPETGLRIGPDPSLTAALEEILGRGAVLFR